MLQICPEERVSLLDDTRQTVQERFSFSFLFCLKYRRRREDFVCVLMCVCANSKPGTVLGDSPLSAGGSRATK